VASAQTTPAWLDDPPERCLDCVLRPYVSEIDGFAARATSGKEALQDRVCHDRWAPGAHGALWWNTPKAWTPAPLSIAPTPWPRGPIFWPR